MNIGEKAEEARESQVTKQMEHLKGQLHELENGITNLRGRLSSVLRVDTLDGGDQSKDEPESLVQLANDIRQSASRVIAVNIDIAVILRELEL